jgi:hypothetical protein
MAIKHAEQTNNYEVTRKYSVSWGNDPKLEMTETIIYANSTWELLSVWTQRQNWMQV